MRKSIVRGGMSEFYYHSLAVKLRQGAIISYPCEGLYGVGCDPFNLSAVSKILDIKQRSMDKGLIVVAANTDQLRVFVEDCWLEKKALQQTWAGAVTWLCPAKDTVPYWLTGNHVTLAVRVSAHPVIQRICSAFDAAIVSTSMNLASHAPLRSKLLVRSLFGRQLDVICKGSLGGLGQETRIFDAQTGQQIR